MLDPVSHKDGFPNPDHVWTSFEVLVFLTAQGDWNNYDTPFACFMLQAQFIYSYSEKGCRKKCARDNSER